MTPLTVFQKKILLGFIFLAALGLRLAGAPYGLPHLYEPDEPHAVNHAIRFGSGDLNPHDFKYPAGLFYVLFMVYGGLFGLWRLAGRIASVNDFGVLFVTDPCWFYLLGRAVTALAASLASPAAYCIGKRLDSEKAGFWSAALIAIAPPLVTLGAVIKQDSWILLLCMIVALQLLNLLQKPDFKHYLRAGFALGAATSFHYMAGFWCFGLIVTQAMICLKEKRPPWAIIIDKNFWAAAACALLTFFALNPFAVLDAPQFLSDLNDLYGISVAWNIKEKASWPEVAQLMFCWDVKKFCIGLLGILGILKLFRQNALSLAPLIAAMLFYFVLVGRLPESGVSARHALAGLWPMLIFSGAGMAAIGETLKRLSWPRWSQALPALFLIPMLSTAVLGIKKLLLPDTRSLAYAWINANLAHNSVILMDMPYLNPQLKHSKDQLKSLLATTQYLNHPRKDYYRLLLQDAPSQGFWIYRIKRSAYDIKGLQGHTERSYQAQHTATLEGGVLGLKKQGIQYLVMANHEKKPDRQLWGGLPEDLEVQAKKIMAFEPQKNRVQGPYIQIFKIR